MGCLRRPQVQPVTQLILYQMSQIDNVLEISEIRLGSKEEEWYNFYHMDTLLFSYVFKMEAW